MLDAQVELRHVSLVGVSSLWRRQLLLDTLPSPENDDCGTANANRISTILLFLLLSSLRDGDSFRVAADKYLHTELISSSHDEVFVAHHSNDNIVEETFIASIPVRSAAKRELKRRAREWNLQMKREFVSPLIRTFADGDNNVTM